MKIYNSVLVYEDDVVNISKVVDDEINLLVEPYQTRLSDDELETLKDLLSSTALTAEQTGFEVGMRFAIKLIFSLLSD
ncbi:MAG: hypothetical protein J6L69_08220 [Lachnospiraceae bacterium]|nr:hypothetical protein [Lachnospiraceae bacterium]